MKRLGSLFWIGSFFFGVVCLFAAFGPMIRPPFDERVAPPYLPPSAQFWLGTDEQGRDIAARLAMGARVSLQIGLTVQMLALLLGVTLGILAVYGPPWARSVILRLTDGMLAFPDILLAILILGIWSFGMLPVIVALAITAWPTVLRLVRAQVATLKDREFIVASRALGNSLPRVVWHHVLPQLWGILLAVSMVDLAGIILAESSLSFLGIGVQPPTPSWGSMINIARQEMLNPAHQISLLWPCLALSITVFALNFIGDALRAWADPRSRSRRA
ncbi:MAG: ABC transporter permease [Chthonomonas sp.]|nr:ABC transporter permease [Chthonomonas sp.]